MYIPIGILQSAQGLLQSVSKNQRWFMVVNFYQRIETIFGEHHWVAGLTQKISAKHRIMLLSSITIN